MQIIIIGAGIIGTLTAYHLAKAGHEVTLIDKHGSAGHGTSFANAAQLSYTYAEPLADPAILPKIPRWLLSKDAPVDIHFRADPAMWKWCLQLLMQSTPKRFAANRDAILKLAMQSREVMEAFLQEHSLQFDYTTTGKLHLFPDKESFARAKRNAAYKQSLGYPHEILEGKSACIAKEPALKHYPGPIEGGVFSSLDATGGTYQFIQAVINIMQQHYPVHFQFDTTCTRIITKGMHIQAIETDKGTFQADAYIVAAGVESTALLRNIGIDVPIYPLKGYSITVPIIHSDEAPHISITDHSRKIVYARLGNRLRVAGSVELAGYDLSCPTKKMDKLKSLINNIFPGVCDLDTAQYWAGLRPATPSSVPIIGEAKPYNNLFLNIGHGMLGWTLAQGSAQRLFDIINKNQ